MPGQVDLLDVVKRNKGIYIRWTQRVFPFGSLNKRGVMPPATDGKTIRVSTFAARAFIG